MGTTMGTTTGTTTDTAKGTTGTTGPTGIMDTMGAPWPQIHLLTKELVVARALTQARRSSRMRTRTSFGI